MGTKPSEYSLELIFKLVMNKSVDLLEPSHP